MSTVAAGGRNLQSKRPRRTRLLSRLADRSDPSVTREEVLAAVASAVGSEDFPATARNRRFLEYVVRHALDGDMTKISGYHVATEVFGRAPDFNPTTDPIVRIEAAKLRRDLETYYLKSGARAAVRITLPRGGYVPVFHRATVTEDRAALDPQAITVHALHGENSALARTGPAFRARVIDRLARQADLSVFAGPASAAADGLLDSDSARELGRRNGTRFVMSGAALPGGDGEVVFTARLHDGQTGRLLWSEDIAGQADALDEVVVARTLAAQRVWAARLDGGSDLPA